MVSRTGTGVALRVRGRVRLRGTVRRRVGSGLGLGVDLAPGNRGQGTHKAKILTTVLAPRVRLRIKAG